MSSVTTLMTSHSSTMPRAKAAFNERATTPCYHPVTVLSVGGRGRQQTPKERRHRTRLRPRWCWWCRRSV
jgi:hypothetical protein